MAHAPSITHPSREQAHDLVTLRVPIGRRCCAACADLVERRLCENAHIKSVRVDGSAGIAYVSAVAGSVSLETLQQIAGECCGGHSPVPLPDAAVSSHQHAHTAKLEAGAYAATKGEHAGMAHAAHDMSDPRMAVAMEADMRRRFAISLVLAIPVVAYASLGMLVLGE